MLLRHNLIVVITISSLFGVQSRNRIRDPYRFNHPPSIETVESVPVAVAYKSGDAREEKSINLSANFRTTSEEDLHSTKNYEKAVPSYIQNKSSDVAEPEKIENKNIARSSNRKSSTRLNLEIPVNVVYDTESGVVDADKGSDQSVTTSIKKLNHFTRRLQKSKIGQSSVDEVAIIDNKLKEKESIENTAFIESLSSLSVQNNPISSPEPKSIGLERKGMRTRAPVVPIVTEKNFVYAHSGKFHYSFEGGDGTKVFEEGSLKTINDEAGEAVRGGFSYTDEEGNDYSLSYTADENGYQPFGAHLPTPPPIPPAIARALAYLATKTIPQTTEATRKLA